MKKMKYVLLSTLLLTCGVFTSCNNTSKVDVMVIGVNNGSGWEETSTLIANLKNKKEEKIDNISFHIGKIDNKNVAVAESPIGTSEAAMTTTIGIKQYHPKYVISEGTAGGHHEALTYYDIVLGSDVLDMASYEGNPTDPSSMKLQHPTLHSDTYLLNKAKDVKTPVEETQIVDKGVIASSDCWNRNKEYVNTLHEHFHEDCEEMESYAVLNVCTFYKTPALAIRIISNNLTRNEDYDKTKEVGKFGQLYTIDVINAI